MRQPDSDESISAASCNESRCPLSNRQPSNDARLCEMVERHDAEIYGRNDEQPGIKIKIERLEHHQETRRRLWQCLLVIIGGTLAAIVSGIVGWIVGTT